MAGPIAATPIACFSCGAFCSNQFYPTGLYPTPITLQMETLAFLEIPMTSGGVPDQVLHHEINVSLHTSTIYITTAVYGIQRD